MKQVILVLSLTLLFSCNSADDYDINCTAEFVYGLRVSVVDTNSQTPIIDNIIVTATEGEYSETLDLQDDVFLGAGERPGTYTISVVADGYVNVSEEGVFVDATFCHVITEAVEIRLFPN